MEELKLAQDLIKTSNTSVECGFNMFVFGENPPIHNEYHDHYPRHQGYMFAKEMARKGEIAFTYKFKCKCGGYPLM
jgi:hypothetical protein